MPLSTLSNRTHPSTQMDSAINRLLDLPNRTLQHIANALAHIILLLGCGVQTLAVLWGLSLLQITISNFMSKFWYELKQVCKHK